MAKNNPILITWLGHSAFLLGEAGGKTVLVDPWLDNPKSPVTTDTISRPDLILVTHGHSDHVGNTVALAERFRVPVVAIYELYLHLQARGVRDAVGMNKGGTMEVAGVSLTMTHAVHSADIDVPGNESVLPGGEAAGFVIRIPGLPSVYHAGDTQVFGDMKLIRDLYEPDIAILPIGGVYTMGPREAAMAVSFLRPRWIIGMHYGTFPLLAGTPAELKSHLPPGKRSVVAELSPGTPRTFG